MLKVSRAYFVLKNGVCSSFSRLTKSFQRVHPFPLCENWLDFVLICHVLLFFLYLISSGTAFGQLKPFYI